MSADDYNKFIEKKDDVDLKTKLPEYLYDLADAFSRKLVETLPPYRPLLDYKVNLQDLSQLLPYRKAYGISGKENDAVKH